MYAVIKTGGKQYKVAAGQKLRVETLKAEQGEAVSFDEVLLIANEGDVKVGTPLVEGAKVTGEVVSHGRAKKIKILKFKRRKHHMKRQGHRQNFTEVLIKEING
jgi:large subunit ribosomal protein L21